MKNNQGFTLIEVVIAMVIMALGLLGLAGLQATSLKNNQSAYHRSLATQLAYDLADRMRANKAEADAGSYVNAIPNGTINANCTTTTGCTTAQMADHDIAQWQNAVSSILPLGCGTLTFAATYFTININWDDNRDGKVSWDLDNDGVIDTEECKVVIATPNDPNFQMSFQL